MNMGPYGAGRLRKDLHERSLSWDFAFDTLPGDAKFEHMVDMVSASVEDIYTAYLPKTRHFFASVKEGQVKLLAVHGRAPDFACAVDLLAVAVTHTRIARTGVAEMRSPGYWIAADDREPGLLSFGHDPVFPVAHLGTITGFDDLQLRMILSPLVRDNAIRVVRSDEGVVGVVTRPRIANDGLSRRFFRR